MPIITRLFVLCLALLAGAVGATETVNLNTASADAIAAGMVGIGPAKAKEIVEYRQKNGPFKSVDDLRQIKGIGEKTLEKNRDRISTAAAH